MEKAMSPAEIKKQQRNDDICSLHESLRQNYRLAADCYTEIARRVGCSMATVITVLQKNNKI